MIRQAIFSTIYILFAQVVLAGIAASHWQLQDGTPLMRAAQDGDVVKVQKLLRQGQNANEQNKKAEATPLIFAASAGQADVVKLLLKNGANPNLCAWANMCPIWYAIRSGSYEAVVTLIEAGANVNNQPDVNALEYPSLQIVAGGGRADIVKLLLDHGIVVDYTNFFAEQTALTSAVASGHANIAQMLIEHGASLGEVTDVPYYNGQTALEFARKKGHQAAVKVIETALKSGKYNQPKYSVELLIDKLYRDPTFDLSAQDKELVKFLRKQTKETLRHIRNTIFASKNYRFDDPKLVDYFRKRFPSYKPITRKYDMSDIDKLNIQFMKEIEEYRAVRDAAG